MMFRGETHSSEAARLRYRAMAERWIENVTAMVRGGPPDSFSLEDLHTWLERRPGLFERDGPNRCEEAALDHFRENYCSAARGIEFHLTLKQHGYGPVPTTFGGYILERIDQ